MRLPWNRKKDGETPAQPPPAVETETPPPPHSEKKGWLTRLRQGMSRSASALTDGVSGIFTIPRLDVATLEELEALLIQSDLGADLAMEFSAQLGR